MFKSIRNVVFPALLLSSLSACAFIMGEERKLLFAYNLENGDGLHLAYSDDGYKWTPLKNGEPFLKSEIGSKLLRDPSLIEPERGEFHMIWATGESDQGFGYASSKDLIKWSEQRLVPISDKLKAYNTRSPILFYERKVRLFHIIWSATVPGLREEKVEEGEASNIFLSITTRDFVNFTEPKVFHDPKYNCPDGSLLQVGDEYKLVFKDGRPDQGTLRISSAPMLNGKWDEPTNPIANVNGIENPSVVKFGGDWLIYFYQPQNNLSYGALRSRDFVQWEDVSSQMSFPQGMKHGSVMRIPDGELEVLQKEK
jgi:sucrose-6-phosphate hydrolase SacC (GH32 family)